MIYLDNAATTLKKPPEVIRRVKEAVSCMSSPGRGAHQWAAEAAETLYRCREKAAELFGVTEPERVVVTFNATHGLNIAVRSLVKPGDRVLISGYEHNAVLRPLHALGAKVEVFQSELFEPGNCLLAFESRLTEDTKLVVCNHISNVFGFVQPVQAIARVCRERGIPLVIDASQSAGVEKISFSELQAAFIAMPGHKALYGPQGTGILLCGCDDPVPLLYGGTGSDSKPVTMPEYLPDRLEAGTHNMPGLAGLEAGLDFVLEKGTERISAYEKKLMGYLTESMRRIGKTELYASEKTAHQAAVLSFNIPGMEPETVAEELSKRGIAVRAGLHCAPLAHETAGTAGTVRASLSVFTSRREVNTFLNAVEDIAGRHRLS
ncbi:MAG: aminotransferase class V-fold PLP-dependent enzyme [Oscillospiraceae bacterium]|nr:aminotransferase class V-fold PLP-dependent enzyme [Oscillospiraceae bacterium]